jgi:hypothetical protein
MPPMIRVCYQRFLEHDLLADVPAGIVPMWSWPVPLSDGSTILTLLYRPLTGPNTPHFQAATRIFHLTAGGDAELWRPGVGYAAAVIFYANAHDHLVGLDLNNPRKLYACTVAGAHLWTLETSIRFDNLIAPESFHQRDNQLHWRSGGNIDMTADLVDGIPRNVRPAQNPPTKPFEVHHPHTHVVSDRLYVLDFDPMARITCYTI